jgi:L-fucose mutarotase
VLTGRLIHPQILEALGRAGHTSLEAAAVMRPERSGPYGLEEDPEIWHEFEAVLSGAGADVILEPLDRFAFSETACSDDVALVIATGEQRIYANLLLTIGVVMPHG